MRLLGSWMGKCPGIVECKQVSFAYVWSDAGVGHSRKSLLEWVGEGISWNEPVIMLEHIYL